MGFTGLALGAMLFRDGVARARRPEARRPRPGEGEGGHLDLPLRRRQPRRELRPQAGAERYAGKSIDTTPYKDVLNPSRLKDLVSANPQHGGRKILMGLNTGFRKYGESGLEVGDWWQHVGVVRRRPRGGPLALDDRQRPRGPAPVPHGPARPRGRASDDRLVGQPTAWARSTRTCRSTSCWASRPATAAAARGPMARPTSGRSMPASGSTPTPRSRCRSSCRARAMSAEDQAAEFGLLGRLNRLAGIDYPDDPALRARIKSYELAFGMQTAVPETLKLEEEAAATQALYGLDRDVDPAVRPALPVRSPAGRARRAVRPDLPRRRRWRRLGRPRGHQGEPRPALGPGRLADRRPAEGPEAARDARRDDRRLGHRVRPIARAPRPTAATTTRRASAPGWPAAASRAASSTAPPTRSASTPSRTAITSPTSTPRCCASWAWTRSSWKSPAASAWRSTTASRSRRSSPEDIAYEPFPNPS